jgi:AraC-like DNA-binding protein
MSYQYITVDNPNISLLSSEAGSVPYGYLIQPTVEKKSDYPTNAVAVQDMFLPNFSLRVSEGQFDRDAVFVNTSAEGLDLIGTCMMLKGSIKSSVGTQKDGIVSFNGSQNFKYDPNNIFVHTLPAGSPFHIAHFSFRPEYIFQYLPEEERWTDTFKKKIENRESFIGDRYVPITLLQERALQTIFNCPLTGQLGQAMIETAIVQIILIQLHSLFQRKDMLPAKVAKRDLDVIHSVKEYLSHTFLNDHSLEALARHFGVNTTKLMTLFKTIFNKSIFEYLHDLKMEHARTLLEERGQMVGQVAREVGYKNPHHFSAAFKKRFGISPSHLK